MAEQPKSSPIKTATDLTIQHYQNPKVRQVIFRFVEEEYGWRALNGDQGWYKTEGNGKVRLRSSEDYEDTISMYRSLYAALDLLGYHQSRGFSRSGTRVKKHLLSP